MRISLEAAASAAVRSAPLETAASEFAAVCVLVVISLLSTVATPVVAPFVVKVVSSAAASGSMHAAFAAAAIVVFIVALRAVHIAASLVMPAEGLLPFWGFTRSGSGTGSRSGSGTEPHRLVIA
jgi:hypothetical protein